ncbi:MAG: PilW family protein [Pseudomonadota bacterium]
MNKQLTTPAQQGYTLIELLVGLLIGLFLSGAAIQSYLSTKETYTITQNVNRVQEDSRFATFFLSRDLRETTNLGCIKAVRNMLPAAVDNNLTDLLVKVGGWDHDDTSLGDEVNLDGNYAVQTNRTKWRGLNNGTNQQLPDEIDSISFSDSIVIKKITPVEGATITATADATTFNVTGYTPQTNEILIIGDCFRSDQFQVGAVTGTSSYTVTPNPSTTTFGQNWGPSARLYSVTFTNYYVGLRSGASVPSLFRLDSAVGATAEELVEGVESMQVLYGLDLDNDGDANRYVSARDLSAAEWEDLVSIRVGLLFVAPGGIDEETAEASQTYSLAGGIDFTTAVGDRDLRYVANVTVKTRNLGLESDFSVCDAGVTNCDLNGMVVTSTP